MKDCREMSFDAEYNMENTCFGKAGKIFMRKPSILRKRYIPYEIVDISGDELLYRSDELLITRWTTIRPRPDFYGGISYAFLKEGFKLGKFYDSAGSLLYWYCDMVDVLYDSEKDEYTFEDLLIDIKVLPGGEIKVLDADELAVALEKSLITVEQACRALKTLDRLLRLIYEGNFPPKECMEYGF